jgi:hypothetical protein
LRKILKNISKEFPKIAIKIFRVTGRKKMIAEKKSSILS